MNQAIVTGISGREYNFNIVEAFDTTSLPVGMCILAGKRQGMDYREAFTKPVHIFTVKESGHEAFIPYYPVHLLLYTTEDLSSLNDIYFDIFRDGSTISVRFPD